MGRGIHGLEEVDLNKRTAVCNSCGPTSIYVYEHGPGLRPDRECKQAKIRREVQRLRDQGFYSGASRKPWVKLRLPFCEACGSPFGVHAHHIDRDKSNNRPVNLVTLCHQHHVEAHR